MSTFARSLRDELSAIDSLKNSACVCRTPGLVMCGAQVRHAASVKGHNRATRSYRATARQVRKLVVRTARRQQ
jgi:hypothetical protein